MSDGHLQLGIDFESAQDSDANSRLQDNGYEIQKIPVLNNDSKMPLWEKIDVALHQIAESPRFQPTPLYRFIFQQYYIEGKDYAAIQEMLQQGIEGLKSVGRERVRLAVNSIREEISTYKPSCNYIKGIYIRKSFRDELRRYTEESIGEVIKDEKLLSLPTLNGIAAVLNRNIIKGDTTIPMIVHDYFMVSRAIEHRVFNAHMLGVYYLLQHEVRPMSLETILAELPAHRSMKSTVMDERVVRLILQYDRLFRCTRGEDGTVFYQLRYQFLNITQQLASIIYEKKELTSVEIFKEYTRRGGKGKAETLTTVRNKYPWCIPIGRSKWKYQPDCTEMRMPADVVREYCLEHKRFMMDDLFVYLAANGYNLNEASVRLYVTQLCRVNNKDRNYMCLVSEVKEEEDSQWRIKSKVVHRNKPRKPWHKELDDKIAEILQGKEGNMMPLCDMRNECMYIIKREKVAVNNFYKRVSKNPALEIIEVDGVNMVHLCPPGDSDSDEKTTDGGAMATSQAQNETADNTGGRTVYAVVGSGAVGSYLGAKLAVAGENVNFLFHTDYRHVMKKGLHIESCNGDIHLGKGADTPEHEAALHIYGHAEDMPKADVVIVALKTMKNYMLTEMLRPLLKSDTLVLLIQNGIGVEEEVQQLLPNVQIAGGIAYICASRSTAGRIVHQAFGRIEVCNYSCKSPERLDELVSVFKNAGVPARIDDLKTARWRKSIYNIPTNGLSVILNTTTDVLFTNQYMRTQLRELMYEVLGAAHACGVAELSDDYVDKTIEVNVTMPAFVPSTKQDYDAGRTMEIDTLYSNAIRQAREHGFDMPRTAMIEAQLRLLEEQLTKQNNQ